MTFNCKLLHFIFLMSWLPTSYFSLPTFISDFQLLTSGPTSHVRLFVYNFLIRIKNSETRSKKLEVVNKQTEVKRKKLKVREWAQEVEGKRSEVGSKKNKMSHK